jgi:ornithine carbamoyltransferase
MKRDFLTIFDITEDEIASLLKRAIEMKSGVDANK